MPCLSRDGTSFSQSFVFTPVQAPLGVSLQLGEGEDWNTAPLEGLDLTGLFLTLSGAHACTRVHESGPAWESRWVVGVAPVPALLGQLPTPCLSSLSWCLQSALMEEACFSKHRSWRACLCVGSGPGTTWNAKRNGSPRLGWGLQLPPGSEPTWRRPGLQYRLWGRHIALCDPPAPSCSSLSPARRQHRQRQRLQGSLL